MTTRFNDASHPGTGPSAARPKLDFNADKYREHLDGIELTEAQQNEMLQVLWNIMSAMVDMGWGVDSVQMFLPELFEKAGADSDKLLEQNSTHATDNPSATANSAVRKDSTDE